VGAPEDGVNASSCVRGERRGTTDDDIGNPPRAERPPRRAQG
jgi:hypothetical protein